jgi:chromosome segregation ATPase
MSYDGTYADGLANSLDNLCRYSEVEPWKQEAQAELERMAQAHAPLDEARQQWQQRAIELTAQLQEMSQQPLLKRIFGNPTQKIAVEIELESARKQERAFESEVGPLQMRYAHLQMLLDFCTSNGPTTRAEQDAIMKRLRLEKKELMMHKRETSAEMSAVRQAARKVSSEAGKTGLFGPYSLIKVGEGDYYSGTLAAAQRRGIRHKRDEMLEPLESTKSDIEQKILTLEKHLLWVERFGE